MFKNERDNMKIKEYDHGDHMAVMSELLVLYKLRNETQSKIEMAERSNDEMKELQKKKEENDDEIPF